MNPVDVLNQIKRLTTDVIAVGICCTVARRVLLFFNRIMLHTKNRAIVMTARYAEILCVNFYRKNQID